MFDYEWNEIIDRRIARALENAEEAFWAEIGKEFDDAVDGHMDPLSCFRFSEEMKKSVKEWVENNVPEPEDLQR